MECAADGTVVATRFLFCLVLSWIGIHSLVIRSTSPFPTIGTRSDPRRFDETCPCVYVAMCWYGGGDDGGLPCLETKKRERKRRAQAAQEARARAAERRAEEDRATMIAAMRSLTMDLRVRWVSKSAWVDSGGENVW